MNAYDLTNLDHATLLGQLSRLVAGERAATAVILAHIAEVDLRRLYLPAAYPSMYAYCVGALRLAEGAAYRRVRSARVARRFPRLFEELASGRLHLSAISMLAPQLRDDNLDELIAAARGRTRSELEAWLARRFPAEGSSLPPAQVRVMGVVAVTHPTPAEFPLAAAFPELPNRLIPGTVDRADEPMPAQAMPAPPLPAPPPAPTPAPLAPPPEAPRPPAHPYFVLRVALGESTHAKLERAQVLLAHSVRAGEVAEVLDRALDALLARLEVRRGATTRPGPQAPARPPRTERTDGRNIPAAIRREVWTRDGGRCTFASAEGRLCGADRGLEFDHVQPVARGGASTAANLRLRCRAHNQLEAERAFGRDFMQQRRERNERNDRREREREGP